MHERVLLTQLINSFVVWMLVFVTVGCGSSVATSTGPSPTKCPITLAVPATPVASSGATATVELTTQPECVWSASSDASWISAVTPSSGQASAQLQLQVAANPDASVRQSEIVVN